MDKLRGYNEEKLWRKMFMDADEFENWFKDLGLLHRRRYCCNKQMNLCSSLVKVSLHQIREARPLF